MKHPYTNLIEAQCHGINLLESMVGRITDVYSLMSDNGGRDSFSSFTVGLRYENGAIGSFLGTMDANEYNRLSQLIEIGGTDGRILIEDNVRRFSFQKTHVHTEEVWQAGFFKDEERSFNHDIDLYLEDMLRAFKNGEEPPVHAREGLRALEIAYAAIESFNEGKIVHV
jgi:predicted dehydrogenase